MSLAPPPLIQFTLRQLMAAMGVICVLAALCYWIGAPLAVALIVLLAFGGCLLFFVVRRQFNKALIVFFIGFTLACLLLPAVQSPGGGGRRASCANNLRNIALALWQYHDIHGTFPPAYIADEDGRPMHSWRVLLLPYLDQRSVYRQYRFDEPWDGPNNSALAFAVGRLRCYECPSSNCNGESNYVAIVGSQTIWPGSKTTKMVDIKDGAANTIILVETHNSGIHWMEPRDLDIADIARGINPPLGMGISSGHVHGVANVAFADGMVKAIDNKASPKALRAALTIAGGEKVALPIVREPR